MKNISVIIVTFNSAATIEACLDSINNFLDEENFEIIVVDNNSGDETIKILNQRTDIILIKNENNLGFAVANQQAVKLARGEYYFLFNPDIELLEPMVKKIMAKFKNDKSLAVIGPQIVYPSGQIQLSVRRFPTISSQILILSKLSKLPWLVNLATSKHYLAPDFDYATEQTVDQVMGAAFFTPAKVWHSLGGFDPRFFIWFEEVDYCFQAKKLGLKVMYTPDVKVAHLGGQSFNQVNGFTKRWWYTSSLIKYFLKNGL